METILDSALQFQRKAQVSLVKSERSSVFIAIAPPRSQQHVTAKVVVACGSAGEQSLSYELIRAFRKNRCLRALVPR